MAILSICGGANRADAAGTAGAVYGQPGAARAKSWASWKAGTQAAA